MHTGHERSGRRCSRHVWAAGTLRKQLSRRRVTMIYRQIATARRSENPWAGRRRRRRRYLRCSAVVRHVAAEWWSSVKSLKRMIRRRRHAGRNVFDSEFRGDRTGVLTPSCNTSYHRARVCFYSARPVRGLLPVR